MKTILVANRKGGCGKTLSAITLATALADGGWKVGLADADPQKSATRWLKRRPGSAVALEPLAYVPGKGLAEVERHLDWVIIDAPGALDGEAAQAMVAGARAVITPVLPAFFDAEATRRFLRELAEIKRIRKGKVALEVIANRVRPRDRTGGGLARLYARIGQEGAAEISERVAYPDLAEQGLSVFDTPGRAHAPLRAQWAPLIRALVA